jgi:hypothetical protein
MNRRENVVYIHDGILFSYKNNEILSFAECKKVLVILKTGKTNI